MIDEFLLLRYAHILGAIVMGAGLLGVWIADLRSRQVRSMSLYSECARFVAIFYDGLVVPGALLLLVSGSFLIFLYYDGLGFLDHPWLVGMVGLFIFEFIEGNTLTRLHFSRLRRLSAEPENNEKINEELNETRKRLLPTFAHFLDLPMIALIVALAVIRPDTWDMFFAGTLSALAIAITLTFWITKLYPWPDRKHNDP